MQSGKVRVKVSNGNLPEMMVEKPVTVNSRSGLALTSRAPEKKAPDFNCGPGCDLSVTNPPVDGEDAGKSVLFYTFRFDAVKLGGDGPNTGYKYVGRVYDERANPNPANPQDKTFFYWTIAPDADNPMSEFYKKQCGNYVESTDQGFISGATFQALATNHESGPTNSHYASYKASQDNPSNNLGTVGETIVGAPSVGDREYEDEVNRVLADSARRIGLETKNEPCLTNLKCFFAPNGVSPGCDRDCRFRGYLNIKTATKPYADCPQQ